MVFYPGTKFSACPESDSPPRNPMHVGLKLHAHKAVQRERSARSGLIYDD